MNRSRASTSATYLVSMSRVRTPCDPRARVRGGGGVWRRGPTLRRAATHRVGKHLVQRVDVAGGRVHLHKLGLVVEEKLRGAPSKGARVQWAPDAPGSPPAWPRRRGG